MTPVRAMPRPPGSSRQTVTWPTRTPATSVIAFSGPGSSAPIRTPSSRRRGPRGAGGPDTARDPYAVGSRASVIPVVWSDAQRLHDPRAEIWVGVRTPAVEVAARADAIRAALERAGPPGRRRRAAARRRAARRPRPRAARVPRRRVGDVGGVRADRGPRPGPRRAVLLPAPRAARAARAGACPPATWARTGAFAFDTMTLIGPGTWEAARGAADAALTAADLVLDGERPPRTRAAARRATTSRAARTAAPATSTTPRSPPRACARRSAGRSRCSTSTPTTATARRRSSAERADVLTGSVHVDPAAGWFPHFLGFAGEDGGGRATATSPLAPGSGDERVARRGARARAAGRAASSRARWSSRSASTPRPATRRARSR